MQGHSWTNPDDQRMLQALQNKLDTAYTLLIMWQVSVWYLKPMEKKAKGFSFVLLTIPLCWFLIFIPFSRKEIWITTVFTEHMHWILRHYSFT